MAIEQILAGAQQDFPVVANGEVVGVLTRGDLLTGLAKGGQAAEVGDFMQREFRTAAPSEMAEPVLGRLRDCKCRTLPVLADGQLVGVFTMENLGEFMMIQTALRGARQDVTRYAPGIEERAA